MSSVVGDAGRSPSLVDGMPVGTNGEDSPRPASTRSHSLRMAQRLPPTRKGPTARTCTDHLCLPRLGFYELSDGGSCSLSTSCTSVCSDRMSSSLSVLLPAAPKTRLGVGDCRPRSADETTVCGTPLPTWGPQATEEGASRPRPVSTGKGEPGWGEGPIPGSGGQSGVQPFRLIPGSGGMQGAVAAPAEYRAEKPCAWGVSTNPTDTAPNFIDFSWFWDGGGTQTPTSLHHSRAIVRSSIFSYYLKQTSESVFKRSCKTLGPHHWHLWESRGGTAGSGHGQRSAHSGFLSQPRGRLFLQTVPEERGHLWAQLISNTRPAVVMHLGFPW